MGTLGGKGLKGPGMVWQSAPWVLIDPVLDLWRRVGICRLPVGGQDELFRGHAPALVSSEFLPDNGQQQRVHQLGALPGEVEAVTEERMPVTLKAYE